jgi:hypothetical protein
VIEGLFTGTLAMANLCALEIVTSTLAAPPFLRGAVH